jgi:hypothetical protein
MEVSSQLHAPAAYPQGKSPWHPLDRRLGGPKSRSGRDSNPRSYRPEPSAVPLSYPGSTVFVVLAQSRHNESVRMATRCISKITWRISIRFGISGMNTYILDESNLGLYRSNIVCTFLTLSSDWALFRFSGECCTWNRILGKGTAVPLPYLSATPWRHIGGVEV